MFHPRISAFDAPALGPDKPIDALLALLSTFDDYATAENGNVASHQDFSRLAAPSLAERYAAASPVARRRFDAVLREAETTARMGMALIVSRFGRADRSAAVAARFLGRSVKASLHRLEALLA